MQIEHSPLDRNVLYHFAIFATIKNWDGLTSNTNALSAYEISANYSGTSYAGRLHVCDV